MLLPHRLWLCCEAMNLLLSWRIVRLFLNPTRRTRFHFYHIRWMLADERLFLPYLGLNSMGKLSTTITSLGFQGQPTKRRIFWRRNEIRRCAIAFGSSDLHLRWFMFWVEMVCLLPLHLHEQFMGWHLNSVLVSIFYPLCSFVCVASVVGLELGFLCISLTFMLWNASFRFPPKKKKKAWAACLG